MALQTIDNLILEIVDRLGGRTELGTGEATGNPPAGRVERALNDALLEVALAYKLPQFEADPPWYFSSTLYSTGTASCSALGVSITGVGTVWNNTSNIGMGWLFKFDSDATWSEILSVPTPTTGDPLGPITVTPRIQSAKSGETYQIVKNQWQMPTASGGQTAASPSDIFAVIDVRDTETQRQIFKADTRMLDKSRLATGNPQYYTRYKDKLFLWPAPDVANVYYRVRYMQRPDYRLYNQTPKDDLSPLPEEWQEIVVLYATAKCLAAQMEFERAEACRALADAKAKTLMSPYAEESEDNNFGLKPSGMFLKNRG